MHRSEILGIAALLLAACGGDAPADPEDAGPVDAGAPADAGSWQPPRLEVPAEGSTNEVLLSRFGLYRDIATKQVAPDLLAFEPTHPLWSDGAQKRRWLRLPPGTRIDSTDMDHWQFPVGTVAFKEFARDGKLLETRIVARTSDAPDGYWMGAFVWRDDESDAVLAREGSLAVRGTTHDAPSQKNCGTCHNGEPGRVLGFSAVQQPQVAAALLTQPPAQPYAVPGDAATSAALGYVHANCGSCHNPAGSARPDTDMNLRLSVSEREVAATAIYRSTVGQKLQYFASAPLVNRVVAGVPEQSGLWFRMSERGPKTQMPPLASKQVDADGLALVRAWITQLPH